MFRGRASAGQYQIFQWPSLHRYPGSTEVVPRPCQERMLGLSPALSCRSRVALRSVQVSLALPPRKPGRASPHQRCTWLPGISGGAHQSTETRWVVSSARILGEDSVFTEKPSASRVQKGQQVWLKSAVWAEILGIPGFRSLTPCRKGSIHPGARVDDVGAIRSRHRTRRCLSNTRHLFTCFAPASSLAPAIAPTFSWIFAPEPVGRQIARPFWRVAWSALLLLYGG